MSDTDAPPPERGPLSVDQAVELIAGPGADREDEAEDSPSAEPDEPDEAEAEAGPADAPHFWGAEDKAAFAELPPHLQEKVAAYERNRDAATSRVIQEAAEARKAAEARASEASDLTQRLAAVVPQAEAAFTGRWSAQEPDWTQVAQMHGPEQALQLKAAFDRDRQAVAQLNAVQQEAEARNFSHYVRAEQEKLQRIEPELVDNRRGPARRGAVVKFLSDNGVSAEQIRHLGAVELTLAYDALRYRLASSNLAQPVRAASGRPSLAPAAAQPFRSGQQRRVEASKARFAKKPSIDNAVAAILAKG